MYRGLGLKKSKIDLHVPCKKIYCMGKQALAIFPMLVKLVAVSYEIYKIPDVGVPPGRNTNC